MMQDFMYTTQSGTENLLEHVEKGMPVYDAVGTRVGKVRSVYFSADAAEHLSEDLPEVIRRRLLQSGFIRISTGLFRADCVATPDQIAGTPHHHITLSVNADELIKL